MDIALTFRRHYRPLCLYALHYLRDADTAEDVVQDCFVRLMEQHDVDNERAWLYRAVRNACLDRLRHDNPIDSTISPTDLDGEITDDEAQQRSQQEADLWTAIDTLPERCREVFLMAKRDGRKYREIAEVLDISEKTVEHQVAKALKVLRGKVRELWLYFF